MKIEAQNTPYCLRRANVAGIEILLDFIDSIIICREFHDCAIRIFIYIIVNIFDAFCSRANLNIHI